MSERLSQWYGANLDISGKQSVRRRKLLRRRTAFPNGLPERIEADLTRQAPHNSYSGGPLYYDDREFTCVDCGRVEMWTAEDQKWWYETAQGSIDTTAVRCRDCRNARVDRHDGTPRRSHRDRRESKAD